MSSIADADPIVHAAPDDAAPPVPSPLNEGTAAEAAGGAWDDDEREEWAAAELRDEMAQRGYW